MRIRNVLFALAAVLFAATPLFAGHAWGTNHWSRSCGTCPATITIHDSLGSLFSSSTDFHDHLSKAVFGDPSNIFMTERRGWNDSAALTLTIVPAAWDIVTRNNCPAVTGAVRVCNFPYGSNGWAGLAQINATNGHINWATAKMNDTYLTNQVAPWRRHVMCQEVGHDFGLGHTSENGTSQNTCMDYYRNSFFADWMSTAPNQHDFDQILTQHHWGTGAASLPFDHLTALRIPGDDRLTEPWEWGTPIAWDREGRADTFARVIGTDGKGNDITIITHALWVDDTGDRRDDVTPGSGDRDRR